ncbi:hypothetical protein AALO_G00089030 [Alosa alosa]|uniref:DBF4-type domain-containing protein n=1 Tax=Alosa alosa TaxID=278164 RepID=A0AAV6GZF9_9TELE|nr:hypothetical protein AALO_G00089030 [Alosa alosa]
MKRSARVQELLGSLRPGQRPLEGKSVYMHTVKSRHASILTDVITRLGGTVEAFLNKDVSFVVTGQKTPPPVTSKTPPPVTSKTPPPVTSMGGTKPTTKEDRSRHPASPVALLCGSRGRALLEKAMHSNERSRNSDVLSSARSWGVKILLVDDFMWCLDLLTERNKQKKLPQTKASDVPARRVVKSGALKTPFIKVEDRSRRYRPLYGQSLSLPELNYRSRFSPFELPTGPSHKPKRTNQQGPPENGNAEHAATPSLKPRRKNPGYCECCQQAFTDQEQHVTCEQHLRFAADSANYVVLDKLIGSLECPFFLSPALSQDPQP